MSPAQDGTGHKWREEEGAGSQPRHCLTAVYNAQPQGLFPVIEQPEKSVNPGSCTCMTGTYTGQHILPGLPNPMPSSLPPRTVVDQQRQRKSRQHEGAALTFASCLVTKSTKPKPLCTPVPVIFFGRRTVFSSPKVLETKGRHRRLGAEACEGGRGSGLRLRSQPLQVTGDRWFQGHPPPRHIHVASHSPTASPHSAGVASFFLLATKWGREGTIRLEVLMEKFWCLSCHLGDTWTPVLSPWDESCTHCARSGRDCLCLRVKARDVGVLPRLSQAVST